MLKEKIYLFHSLRKPHIHTYIHTYIRKSYSLTNNLTWITSFPASSFTQDNQTPYNLLHTSPKASEKSCFWKHYDAFKKIAKQNKIGLVLEDDSIFSDTLFIECENLIKNFSDDCFLINIEYSSDDVPLYYIFYKMVKMKGTKRTGGHIVSPKAAQKFIDFIDSYLDNHHQFWQPIDAFITEFHEKLTDNGVNIYWSVKPLIFQGSKTGRFASKLSSHNATDYYKFYEFFQKYITSFINKLRACFRSKLRKRVIYPVK
ncbi:hypothetical protein F9B74_01960 [Pelistega sp. NLN82]|uniref:Glycosyl transferase family 25 domain-containing protein n=1 Tax=Pelistega ratti TaxID=2652177 RepID=A0A6L9Y3T6_9BURK|nr:glycosyltransferase family 25 protein [Pelistega ratti]NEN75092.1 hypothetical protein [Pelistega ratti]